MSTFINGLPTFTTLVTHWDGTPDGKCPQRDSGLCLSTPRKWEVTCPKCAMAVKIDDDRREGQQIERVKALENLWAAVKDRKSWRVGYNRAFTEACEALYKIERDADATEVDG